jgi:DNA-binding transcriptional ArsR family regulator
MGDAQETPANDKYGRRPSMEPVTSPIDPAAVEAAEEQTLSPVSERRMRRLLDVLCDGTRLKIVRALRDNQLAASDLARLLGRSRSATSQHLRVLREANVVQPSRNGNIVRYQLASDINAQILQDIGRAFDRLEPGTAA